MSDTEAFMVPTTWGPLYLSVKKGNVQSCTLPQTYARLRYKNAPQLCPGSKRHAPAELLRFLDLLFMDIPDSTPRYHPPQGTPFQQAVWKLISHIPHGQTRTYGEIAQQIGNPKAYRAVAQACGKNPLPLFIPCHRVVAQNGIGGYSAGLPWKLALLQAEQKRA